MNQTISDYSVRGPYPVGVLQTTIEWTDRTHTKNSAGEVRALPTEIWYPGQVGQAAPEDAPHPLGVAHRACVDLAPQKDLACPLVGFSHGNSGLRQQSTFLMTHLASWGIVVAAPDHVGNTFPEMMALPNEEARIATHRRIRAQRPHDLHAVIRALLDHEHEPEHGPGHLDARIPPLRSERLGVLGHSFGGWTALKTTALEERVTAVCCLAPASEPFVGRSAFAASDLPLPATTRALILAAQNDVLVDLDTSVRPLFERLGPTAQLEIIESSDHYHFCDGIELLHTMHENNPRENQLRPTRPLGELRSELDMHALLNERVMRFFGGVFGIQPGAL